MRRRSEAHTFEQRLDAQRLRLEHELSSLPAGHQRDSLAARIEQLQAAAEMFDFLSNRQTGAAARQAPEANSRSAPSGTIAAATG